jgi:hypothetical protein
MTFLEEIPSLAFTSPYYTTMTIREIFTYSFGRMKKDGSALAATLLSARKL